MGADSNPNFDKSIVDKIRKLLALADSNRNSHEHEREVAMQAAMDLLAKHNLSMTQIDNSVLDIQTEEVQANFKLEPWVRELLSAACKLYYTKYYMQGFRRWNGRIERVPVFVGTAENIAVTIEMATWLIHSIRQESNYLYTEAFERRSFRLGAADRILARAHEIMVAEKSTTGAPGTSLVVLRNELEKANNAHFATKNFKTFKPRAVYLDENAYADGETFGDQVGLNREMGTDVKRLPQFN